ncbi:MAG: DMT family transporter [Alphaproteobacteria bacterium]|jgi:drug/metabolite transporter (DMT)-like permease|nr:DMT family transporter [Rhodospirillaceae bacterium]MDG2482100.1 DMT family transporter [Alphaproteobacteria bacterium]MBT6203875.1 DMT family transporter [Rhodospirillaceae bacterium]MBT6512831.1 DMT family transporter [Rhodospirillaceae bacterium]MBT7615364.1 DMT family transporter [Rhodospirillaceae bacterium]
MASATPIRHMGPREIALVVICAASFGSSFLFIDIIVTEVPPVTLACARSIVSFLTLGIVMMLARQRLPAIGAIWFKLALLGVATQVVPMILLSWGQLHIDSGLAGIILGMVPVLTMLFAHLLFHDERMSSASFIGAILGFSGVIAVIGRGALGNVEAHLLAELAVLAAAFCIAGANVLARSAGQLTPMALAVGSQASAVVFLIPMSALADQPWDLAVSWQSIGALVVLGTVGSAIPGLIFYHLLARTGATRASLVAYLVPIVAVVLGAVFLHERLPWEALFGMVLIVLGAWLVNQRQRSKQTNWIES